MGEVGVPFGPGFVRAFGAWPNPSTPNATHAGVSLLAVGEVGVEPTRPFGHAVLSRTRIPVPPLARILNFLGKASIKKLGAHVGQGGFLPPAKH